jgi:Na+-translocating ferredoxin:NAD+ oxidoreductase RnfD subunit
LLLGTFKLTLGLFLVFVFLWSISRRRWRMPFAYLMSLGILIALSYFFYPNWFPPYLGALIVNLRGADMLSTGEIISGSFPAIGVRFSYLLSGAAAAVLLWEWWAARLGDYRRMLWVGCLTLALTPLLGLPTNPGTCRAHLAGCPAGSTNGSAVDGEGGSPASPLSS